LWVADITYVRSKAELLYLAVLLDGFSRKVVGWALDHTMMSSRLTVAALMRAVAERQPTASGASLRSRASIREPRVCGGVREVYGMVASMSRPANPFDNAS
jgi:putative transposase